MEDFLTWTDTSAIKKHVMAYNEQVSGFFVFLYFFIGAFCLAVFVTLDMVGGEFTEHNQRSE